MRLFIANPLLSSWTSGFGSTRRTARQIPAANAAIVTTKLDASIGLENPKLLPSAVWKARTGLPLGEALGKSYNKILKTDSA
jgi:hypothetical protein